MRKILQKLKDGSISIEEAENQLQLLSLDHIKDSVVLDIGRKSRKGVPEVIYTSKKPNNMVLDIVKSSLDHQDFILLSRVSKELLNLLINDFNTKFNLVYEPENPPFMVRISQKNKEIALDNGKIGLITAGSSDIDVAAEVKLLAESMGIEVFQFNDIGIAGIHRLLDPLKELIKKRVSVIVVIAGMEGALPSVVAGLVPVPVIGVPTSTGYGFGGDGTGALMSMLQSCVPGLAVVNIDNGINAGAIAALIAKQNNRKFE